MTAQVDVRTVIVDISTHTPLAGRDQGVYLINTELLKFLLTRPLRDVTTAIASTDDEKIFLLTRPLRDVTSACDNTAGYR